MRPPDPERLFLLDGSSLMYRAYYALLAGGRGGPTAAFQTRAGVPTGAVFGFLNTLRKLIREHSPDYIGIAFDQSAPTFRHESFAAYKAHRKPMPDDLRAQVPYVRRVAEALGIPVVVEPRFEADDVLGSLARLATQQGLVVVLVTSDKDMYQLLNDQVSMLRVRTETEMVRAADVERLFGAPPDRVVDVLALWGDSSDNIPGVKGIGEKRAKELVAAYGRLDAIYAHLDELKPGMTRCLREGEADARMSLELATIRTDLDLELDLAALRYQRHDDALLLTLATELEFERLVTELTPPPAPVSVEMRRGPEATVAAFLRAATTATAVTIELASDGIACVLEPRRAYYFPFAGDGARAVLDRLRPVLEDPAVAKTALDLKQLSLELSQHGVDLCGLGHDVGLLAYLLDPGRPARDLDLLASSLLRRALAAPTTTATAIGTTGNLFATANDGASAAERADVIADLAAMLLPQLERAGLVSLYRDIELPLVPVLAAMEQAGVHLDRAALVPLAAEIRSELQTLSRRIHDLVGEPFNIGSPRQLAEALFERLQLPVGKKTRKAKAASTDNEVLEGLAADHEVARLVLRHRELTKLLGTYVDALPALIRTTTGRIHTSFNQAVTQTGRLSSSDPNLQNIPVRTELGRRLRRAFTATAGHALVVADYSQIELRLLAHLSGDPALVSAFAAGADVHTRTAANMFDVAEGLVTGELRRRAKVINFGIIYGMSPFGLGRELGLPARDAAKLIDAYFARYAGVRRWLDATLEQARREGSVRTQLGRVRFLPDINSPNRLAREHAERTAVNTPIQGTAADLIKLAMVRLDRRLHAHPRRARLVLQVHDELVVEAPADEAAETADLVRTEMEGVGSLSIPLVVTIGVGDNWLEAK